MHFSGRFQHTVDAKGRVSVPSKFRDVLDRQYEPTLMVTTWSRCLWCYPPVEWQKIERAVLGLSEFDPRVQRFRRHFLTGRTECPIDSHGRIVLSQDQRRYAGIDRDVYILGDLTKIEIWSAERWSTEVEGLGEEEELEINQTLADLLGKGGTFPPTTGGG